MTRSEMYTVLLFGPAREAVGVRETRVEVDPPVTAERVVATVTSANPALAAVVSHARVAVNHVYVDGDTPVRPSDVIAIIPPVGGG